MSPQNSDHRSIVWAVVITLLLLGLTWAFYFAPFPPEMADELNDWRKPGIIIGIIIGIATIAAPFIFYFCRKSKRKNSSPPKIVVSGDVNRLAVGRDLVITGLQTLSVGEVRGDLNVQQADSGGGLELNALRQELGALEEQVVKQTESNTRINESLIAQFDTEHISSERIHNRIPKESSYYKDFHEQAKLVEHGSPELKNLIQAAEKHADSGEPEMAWQKLEQVRETALDYAQKHKEDHSQQARIAAQAAALEGQLKKAADKYKEAGNLYEQAASLIKPLDSKLWRKHTYSAANAYLEYCVNHVDNQTLDKSIMLYREILRVTKRQDEPIYWSEVQNNLGRSLGLLGDTKGSFRLSIMSIVALLRALDERPRNRVPLDWAETQHYLGSALIALGTSGTFIFFPSLVFRYAVTAYRKALEERTRECTPLKWAKTQAALGSALVRIGKWLGSNNRLEEGITALNMALEETTRKREPMRWAIIQSDLGRVYRVLGEWNKDVEHFKKAEAAHNEALKELTIDRAPLFRAATYLNLGNVLLSQGKLEDRVDLKDKALLSYKNSLDLFKNLQTPNVGHFISAAKLNIRSARKEKCLSKLRRTLKRAFRLSAN